MADNSINNAVPAGGRDVPSIRPVKSTRGVDQNLEELTPLQRQRLDTAVMLLVNYLVSASSSNNQTSVLR